MCFSIFVTKFFFSYSVLIRVNWTGIMLCFEEILSPLAVTLIKSILVYELSHLLIYIEWEVMYFCVSII